MSERIDCHNEEVYKSTREKMNHENGKIYKVWSLLGTEIYIGSTAQKLLSSRMNNHRDDYKRWKEGKYNKVTVFDIFDKYGIENCKIELIEKFPCKDKPELEAREGHHQRLHRDIIVNKCIAGRTRAEYQVDNKDRLNEASRQYYIDNKDQMNASNRQYRVDNVEQIKTSKHQYQVDNKDRLNAVSRQYYSDNKDRLNAVSRQYKVDNAEAISKQKCAKITCACGCIISHDAKSRHIKSIKHQKLMDAIIPP
jgi:LysM repeat protein